MDVRLRLVLHPALVAAVLGRVDRRHIRDLQLLGQRRGGVRDQPVVTVDEVIGALPGEPQTGREHVVVHLLHPRDEPVQVPRPARLGHAIHGHPTPFFDRQRSRGARGALGARQGPGALAALWSSEALGAIRVRAVEVLRALEILRAVTGPAREHVDGHPPAHERLGELAHMPGQAALDHGRVLPGEEQHVFAHAQDPISRGTVIALTERYLNHETAAAIGRRHRTL